MRHQPRTVHRQLRGYLGRLRWVAADAFPRFWRRVALLVLMNFLGVTTAATSLGGVVLFARHASSGQPVHFANLTIQFDGSWTMLLLYGVALALMGIFSGVCLYCTEWLIQTTTRQYEAICIQRIVDIAADPLCRGWQIAVDVPQTTPRASLARLMSTGSRWTAFAFRDMLRAILPVLTFLFSAAALVYTDWKLTLLLMPAAVAYLVPLYLINRSVARSQIKFRNCRSIARADLARGLRRVLDRTGPDQPKQEWRDQILARPDFGGMMHAFYNRVITEKRVQLLNTAFFVFCLLAMFVYFGADNKTHGRPWADMILYVFAVRFAIGSLRQVTSLFVRFSKFLSEFRSYSHFVQRTQRLKSRRLRTIERPQELPDRIALHIKDEMQWDSASHLPINAGEVLCVLTPAFVTALEIEAIAARIGSVATPRFDLAAMAALCAGGGGGTIDPDRPLLETALGVEQSQDQQARTALRQILDRLCLSSELGRLTQDSMTANGSGGAGGSRANSQPLSAEAAFALSVASELLASHSSAVIAMKSLVALNPDFVRRLLGLFDRGFTILVDGSVDAVAAPHIAHKVDRVAGVIVMDRNRIIAGGDLDWFRTHTAQVSQFLTLRGGSDREDIDDADDEDDESME